MYAGVAERSLNRFRAIAAFSVLTDRCRVHRSSKNQFEPFGRVDTPEHGSTRELVVSINGNSRQNLGAVGGWGDTTTVLAQYVSSFHPRLIGLTGTPEQIRTVANLYKAYYAKYTSPDGGVYLIDHTGFTYLMDRAGKYLGFFPPGTSADRMVEIIRPYLTPH